jgi:phosphoribosylaminoimidazole (AIR) synthetase
MVIIVDENETDKIISDLENAGEKVFKIGKIERGKGKVIIK